MYMTEGEALLLLLTADDDDDDDATNHAKPTLSHKP